MAEFERHDDSLNGQSIDTGTTRTRHWWRRTPWKNSEKQQWISLIEDSVFIGCLRGRDVAIKRASPETISRIEFVLFSDAIHIHPNLITLLGICFSTEDPDSYIVFEYANNGCVASRWFSNDEPFHRVVLLLLELESETEDMSRCSHCFMHQVMNPAYVQINIKSRDIFVDDEFNVKVGNFGMARCVEDGGEEDGGRGYLAPEYVEQGVIAPSIGDFAFGVVFLEVLSGQAAMATRSINEKSDDEKGAGLSGKIKLMLGSDDAEELREGVDKAVGENYSYDAAVKLANLARACEEDDPGARPNAGLTRLMVEETGEGDIEFGMRELVQTSGKEG